MTKKNYTEIVLIVDSSGSMRNIAGDVEKAIENLIEEQKTIEGECKLTTCVFNKNIVSYIDGILLDNAPKVRLKPDGYTALFDAIGYTVVNVGERLARMKEEERPEKVIVVIATDGAENASMKYTLKQIQELIKQQTETYSWEFIYIGANQDAYAVGNSLSIKNSISYKANAAGVLNVYNTISDKILRSRTSANSFNS